MEIDKKNVKETLNIFQQIKVKIKTCDPDYERVSKVEKELNNTEKYFSDLVKTQKVQKKIDSFFKPN